MGVEIGATSGHRTTSSDPPRIGRPSKICAYQWMASVQNCSLLQKDSTDEPNGLHARPYWIAPNASCPDMVGWRSWRADRVGRNRERICRIATRRDAIPKKQSATPAMPGGRAYDDYTPFEPIVWSRSVLHEYDELMPEALPVP